MQIYEELILIPTIIWTANLALTEVEKAVPVIERILVRTLRGILTLREILKGRK